MGVGRVIEMWVCTHTPAARKTAWLKLHPFLAGDLLTSSTHSSQQLPPPQHLILTGHTLIFNRTHCQGC